MTLSRDDLRNLAERRESGPCLSIFMPTHEAGPQVRQDPIRLKNLIGEAEERMRTLGFEGARADAALAPLRPMLEQESFWRERSRGIAIFAAPDFLLVDHVPIELSEHVAVGTRFHVRPILPVLAGDGRYTILALSQKQVRGFTATRESIVALPLPGVPKSLEEVAGTDFEEHSLHGHTGRSRTVGGRGDTIVHGQGRGGDQAVQKQEILHLVERVDATLRKGLPHYEDPLVLAGTDEIVGLFRKTSGHPALVEEFVHGSPDGWSEQELHEKTWPLVEPRFLEARNRASEKFPELRAHGRASDDLETVFRASTEGRIAELFVALEADLRGRFDVASQRLVVRDEPGPGDEDLIDEVAVQTLLHDGVVYTVPGREILGGGPVAANFRYPLAPPVAETHGA